MNQMAEARGIAVNGPWEAQGEAARAGMGETHGREARKALKALGPCWTARKAEGSDLPLVQQVVGVGGK